jgi:hypothetical protein
VTRRLAIACVAVLLGLALPAAQAPAATPAHAIAWLNAQRAANGLPAGITGNPAWDAGCANHRRWLTQNPGSANPHEETPATPGYTEDGAFAGSSSVLGGDWTASAKYPWGGANPWETAPIHLMQLLGPPLSVTGYAPGCMFTWPGYLREAPPVPQLLTYPGNATTWIYHRETASESPFVPGQFIGLRAGTQTGPHLYVLAWGAPSGQITSASLTGPSGPLEVRTVDNTTRSSLGDLGGYLPAGGILIPVRPLAPGTTYAASVAFTPSQQPPLTVAWTFATAVAANTMSTSLRRRGRAVLPRGLPAKQRITLNVLTAAPNATLTMNGPHPPRVAQAATRHVAVGEDWRSEFRFNLTAGLWTACASSGGGTSGYRPLQRCRMIRVARMSASGRRR